MPSAPYQTEHGVIGFGPFRLSAVERLIDRSGEPLQLGGRAMDILIALVERAGDVVSQRELIERAWPNVTVDDSNLRCHIKALRKALGDGQDGARYVINVPGRGYCFVAQTARLPTVGSTPAPVGPAAAVPPIPPRLGRMVGRDAVVDAITRRLGSQRFVTIVGPGGIGKTTVAVSIAHALAAEYDMVCFADLGPLSDPRLVPSLIATALGIVVRCDDQIPSLLEFLRDKRLLLILDGCEHVIDMAAGLAEAIFAQAEGVHILATSREALRIEGECAYRLAPLECPPVSDTLKAAEALTFSAARLFANRLAATSDPFEIQDADAPVVARICHKLDGIALAIELAAGRVDAYGIEGVDALLDSKLSLLWQGRRTAPPRHQTLNATLDWSYDLLAEPERTVLRRLVVFAGPFTLEAAQAVIRDNGTDVDEIAEVIATLVAKSLIVSDAKWAKGVCYRLLDTTRAHLHLKLTCAGEANIIARRHAEFFCDLLGKVGAHAPTYSEAYAIGATSEDLGNVRSALEWTFSAPGDVKLGMALAAAAAPLFLGMSLLTECRRWAEKALAVHATTEDDPRYEMELQAALGLSLIHSEGNNAAGLETLTRALDLAEGLCELRPQLQLISALHLFHVRIGDFRGSMQLAKRALDVAGAMDNPTALMTAEWMLGISHHLAGDQTSALIYLKGALPRPAAGAGSHIVRLGHDHRICALCTLARAQWLCGSADDAVDTAHCALAEAETLKNPATLCSSLLATAFVFLWTGNLSEVDAIIERVVSVAKKYSLGPHHTMALGLKGELAIRRDEAAAAIPLLWDCFQTMHSGRHETMKSVFTSHMAEAMAMAGRIDEALATIDGALSEAENKGGSFDMPEILRLKGNFLVNRGASNTAEAEHCFRRSLELAHRQGALGWELRTAISMSRFQANHGRRKEAREMLASVLGRFTQGRQTADLRAAANLLGALGPEPEQPNRNERIERRIRTQRTNRGIGVLRPLERLF
jgi:predicted ATPase/DNA-binding winged helix-turn-helix (wHTH) protein